MADLMRCTKCARELLPAMFSKHGDRPRPDCRDCKSAASREYYERNRDAIRARLNASRAADPEKHKASVKASRAKRLDHYIAKSMEWQRANPQAVAKIAKRFRLAHPEVGRTNVRNRDAKRRAAAGSHTQKDIAELYELQSGKCIYCRCQLGSKYHVDHITALTRGGANDRTNLQLLCPPCNLRKGAKDPIEFAQKLGLLC